MLSFGVFVIREVSVAETDDQTIQAPSEQTVEGVVMTSPHTVGQFKRSLLPSAGASSTGVKIT